MFDDRPRRTGAVAARRRTGPAVATATAMVMLAMIALISGCGRHDRYNDPGDSPSTSETSQGY